MIWFILRVKHYIGILSNTKRTYKNAKYYSLINSENTDYLILLLK